MLTPEEITSVIVGGVGGDDAVDKEAAQKDALDLVTALFDDVDLDHDGRICFTEFEAFCKKAQRAIRRRGIATVTGTGQGPFGPLVHSIGLFNWSIGPFIRPRFRSFAQLKRCFAVVWTWCIRSHVGGERLETVCRVKTAAVNAYGVDGEWTNERP